MKRSAFLTRYIRSQQPVYPKRHWLAEVFLWMLGIWSLSAMMVLVFMIGFWTFELVIKLISK